MGGGWLVVGWFAVLCQAAPITLPPGNSGAPGNARNDLPFNNIGSSSNRVSQVFSAAGFPFPGLITEIRFRADENPSYGESFTQSIPRLRIDLSTTAAAPDALSLTFADNVGPDVMTVFDGPIFLSGNNVLLPDGTTEFSIVIPLSTPFLYNPADGNLLMDIRMYGGPGLLTTTFDAQSVVGDGTSRIHTGLFGDADQPVALGSDSLGLVTQFEIEPVPVPEPGALVALGLAMLAVGRRLVLRRTR